MLDRVREALFSTLGPGIEGAFSLDLFAGSGSLGLEALSRGAAYARLVEESSSVVSVLRDNVETLGVGERVEILGTSALNPSTWRPPAGEPDRWADAIFFDPPYPHLGDERRGGLFAAVRTLAHEVLRPGGLLVFHTPKRGVTELDFGVGLEIWRKTYGSSALWYVRGPEVEAPEGESGADETGDEPAQ